VEIGTDVVIQLEKLIYVYQRQFQGKVIFLTAQSACFFWDQIGTFLVQDSKEIIVRPLPGVEERFSLSSKISFGRVTSAWVLVLHASAVAINSSVVAFLGEGQGKSTGGDSMRGHYLMADDVVALDLGDPTALSVPSFPQFKLGRAAASALVMIQGTTPAYLRVEKRARRAADRFSARPFN